MDYNKATTIGCFWFMVFAEGVVESLTADTHTVLHTSIYMTELQLSNYQQNPLHSINQTHLILVNTAAILSMTIIESSKSYRIAGCMT